MRKCPYCEDGIRTVPVYRFLMHPEVPRDAWEYPEPREGIGEKSFTCCVCRGAGMVEMAEPLVKRGPAVATIKVKQKGEECLRCGSNEDVRKVQLRKGAGKQFVGPVESMCALCRAKQIGSWRWPREKVRSLKVINGGKS